MKNKIIITTPKLDLQGGVSSYVRALKGRWSHEEYYVVRGNRKSLLPRKFLALYDIANFVIKCLWHYKSKVFINTSFNSKAYNRDLFFIKIAGIIGIKPYVFIHGWDKELELSISNTKIQSLNSCSGVFVLASSFKDFLQHNGVETPIHLETTIFEEIIINSTRNDEQKRIKFIFLSRLEKNKGVFILLEAFSRLQKKHNQISLDLIGDGDAIEPTRLYIEEHELKNVSVHGYKVGDEKISLLARGDVFVLPTSHGEGLPISILEAMSIGMPIITRNVGGISDHIENDKSGIITDSINSEDFESYMEKYILNPEMLKSQGDYNKKIAKEKFTPDIVIKRLEASISK